MRDVLFHGSHVFRAWVGDVIVKRLEVMLRMEEESPCSAKGDSTLDYP